MRQKILGIAIMLMYLLSVVPVAAQETAKVNEVIIKNKALYSLNLRAENLWETLSISPESKLAKQLTHAQKRVDEMEWCTENSREDLIPQIASEYTKKSDQISTTNRERVEMSALNDAEKQLDRHTEVLQNMLNSTRMPEQSQKGLETALEASNRLRATVREETEIRAKGPEILLETYEKAFLNVPISIKFNLPETVSPRYQIIVTDDTVVLGQYVAEYDRTKSTIVFTEGSTGGLPEIKLTLSDIKKLSEYAEDKTITQMEAARIVLMFS